MKFENGNRGGGREIGGGGLSTSNREMFLGMAI